MNLIGKNVIHRVYGVGEELSQTATMITVRFPSKETKFQYPNPDTFTKFLKAENPATQAAILEEIRQEKERAERMRAEEEARKKAEEERRAEEQREADERARAALSSKPRPAGEKKHVKQERIPGKRMTFFVFQGSTFDRESRGGYIWALVANRAGLSFHHWERLLDIRPGDIIFHGCDGFVQAISAARGECYDCHQPEELRSEDLWEPEGRRVDCEYILIKNPIKTTLCQRRYSPAL